ncbi:rhodanese-like domain-containing protein [Mycoplasma marinum]|uniref:Thioredoxin n=1 Tax=Mycoplasma marinum TaxID=1937190 RepID=A0A4R0XLA1_9MOLU|nr:rhodanese-like domain-containing protein [Mycoplasma marinum]TCG11244.1 hypothetical protein C4B24_02690 [Mycoplasma marinum]
MKNIQAEWVQENAKEIELIDVRTPEEFSIAHANGAINIPKENLLAKPEKYLDKMKEYYIMCGSGGRSQFVITSLFSKGYNLTNVSGGIKAMNPEKLIIPKAQEIDDSERKILSKLRDTKVNIVIFYSDTCGTCQMQKPVLKTLEQKYEDVSLTELNIIEESKIAKQEQVIVAPTTIIFIEGKEKFRFQGFMPEADILKRFK